MVRLSAQAGQKAPPSTGTIQLQCACARFAHCRHSAPSARAIQWSPRSSSADSVSGAGRKPRVMPQRMQTLFSKWSS